MDEKLDQPKQSLYGESSTPGQEQIKPLGLMDIVSGIFSEPVELFKRLQKKPQWAGAMALIIALAMAFVVAWCIKVDAIEFMNVQFERAMANNAQLQQVSSAQLDQIIEMQAKFLPFMAIVGGLFMGLASVFLGGLAYWAVGLMSTESQPKPTYAHGLVVASVPGLITAPYYLLGTVMAIMNPVGTLRTNQIVPSSLSFWIETDSPKLSVLYGFMDLFMLASYVMIFFAARHALRAKTWGAATCVALALTLPCISILFAK